MSEFNLLVVDDDPLVIQSIRLSLPQGWRMNAVMEPQDLPNKSFHAAFVDIHLTGNLQQREGLDVIRQIRKKDPRAEVVAISGDLDRELMEACLKAGASRFLAKPLSPEEMQLVLEKIEAWWLLQNATERSQQSSVKWVGDSSPSQALLRKIAELKGEQGPILLEGESGTGKEVIAQLIHLQQQQGPFMRINVAAIPETLFESELFGHVKGAFTGADQNKMGLAEAAHDGDLFLDEIEALALPLQAKLLRFLESGEVRRVGSKDVVKVKTRVIAATNCNLEEMVRQGQFREDLLWRLSGKKIPVPPLRERAQDIPALANYFLSQDSRRRKELSPEAIRSLQARPWPGNVRELRRCCEQLIVYSPLPVIRQEDVQSILQPLQSNDRVQALDFHRGLPDLIKGYESQIIAKCLDEFNDVDDVAKVLKISRSSLYKKIKDHSIEWRP